MKVLGRPFPWSRLTLPDGKTIDARRWYPLEVGSLPAMLAALTARAAWVALIRVPRIGTDDHLVRLDGDGVHVRLILEDEVATGDRPTGLPGPAWWALRTDVWTRQIGPPGTIDDAAAEIVALLGWLGDGRRSRIYLTFDRSPYGPGPVETVFGIVILAIVMGLLAAGSAVTSLVAMAVAGTVGGSILSWVASVGAALVLGGVGWPLLILLALIIVEENALIVQAVAIFIATLITVPAVVQDGLWLLAAVAVVVVVPIAFGVGSALVLNAP